MSSGMKDWDAVVIPPLDNDIIKRLTQNRGGKVDCSDKVPQAVQNLVQQRQQQLQQQQQQRQQQQTYFIGVIRGVLPHLDSGTLKLVYTGNLCYKTYVLLLPDSQQKQLKYEKDFPVIDIYLKIEPRGQKYEVDYIKQSDLQNIGTFQIEYQEQSQQMTPIQSIDFYKPGGQITRCEIDWSKLGDSWQGWQGKLPRLLEILV